MSTRIIDRVFLLCYYHIINKMCSKSIILMTFYRLGRDEFIFTKRM